MQITNLVDRAKFVYGSPGLVAGATTGGDGDYVSLKGYARATIVLMVDNATSVTAGDITLKQASAVAGTGEKALAFSTVYANTDVGASDTLVATAVTSNTFATTTTDNKNALYIMEVDASSLDVAGGFDCIRIDSASMANAIHGVLYILHGARNASPLAISAITD